MPEEIHPDIKKTPNCENGWKDGSCNCVHQHALHKHPWNKDIGKGACSETMGWVCAVKYDGEESPMHVTFSDHQHSFCEMHWPTPARDKYVKNRQNARKFGIGGSLEEDASNLDQKWTSGKVEVMKKWKDAGMLPENGPAYPVRDTNWYPNKV